jgi:hypothetical protein
MVRHYRSKSSRIAQRFRWVSLFCKRVAKSLPLFSAWKDGANVTEAVIPPKEVADHFDELYQLKEVPKALQVSIPCVHIYYS